MPRSTKGEGRRHIALALAAILSTAGFQKALAAERIDLALVIAVDVSTSMDTAEKAMQQRGFVEAFRRPEIISAICHGAEGRIAVAYVEWGGAGPQKLVVPWTIIASEADSWSFSLRLDANHPGMLRRGTSLSGALDYAGMLLQRTGYEAARSVVNISGDGVNNIGRELAPARAALLAGGATINGLSVLYDKSSRGGEVELPPEELYFYFKHEVIGGPGAFAEPVRSFSDYPNAIYRKLLREIGGGADVAAMDLPSAVPETLR